MRKPRVKSSDGPFVGAAVSTALAVVCAVGACSSSDDAGFTETNVIHCDSQIDCKSNQECVNHGCRNRPANAGRGPTEGGAGASGGAPGGDDAGAVVVPAGTCRSNADCLGDETCISGHCAKLQGNGGRSGGGNGGASGARCAQDLLSCGVNGDCCNYPATARCVDFGGGTGPVCAVSCSVNAECSENCCVAIDGDFKTCVPASFCPGSCRAPGAVCSANGDCCGYPASAVCVDLQSGPTCAATCSSTADCQGNQCCLPLAGGGGVCGPC